jgi:hypothetical protein
VGLQKPSAPSVLALTPPLGTLCSIQWLQASTSVFVRMGQLFKARLTTKNIYFYNNNVIR